MNYTESVMFLLVLLEALVLSEMLQSLVYQLLESEQLYAKMPYLTLLVSQLVSAHIHTTQ